MDYVFPTALACIVGVVMFGVAVLPGFVHLSNEEGAVLVTAVALVLMTLVVGANIAWNRRA